MVKATTIIMEFTTILQIKLALGLMILIAVYFIIVSFDKGIEAFKNGTKKNPIHIFTPIKK